MIERPPISTPSFVRFGSGKRAVLLSPVLPIWDNGAYFGPLTHILNDNGYDVTIYDTLSLMPGLEVDLLALAQSWDEYLVNIGKIDLLGGAAMGGSVVQTILGGASSANQPDVLLLSSPTICDGLLKDQLQKLADTAIHCGSDEAMKLLSRLVQPIGARDQVPSFETFTAAREATIVHRLQRGFEILTSANATANVTEFGGRLLHLYGEASRLVGPQHIVVGTRPTHRRIGLPACGMRPLADALAQVSLEVVAYLDPATAR